MRDGDDSWRDQQGRRERAEIRRKEGEGRNKKEGGRGPNQQGRGERAETRGKGEGGGIKRRKGERALDDSRRTAPRARLDFLCDVIRFLCEGRGKRAESRMKGGEGRNKRRKGETIHGGRRQGRDRTAPSGRESRCGSRFLLDVILVCLLGVLIYIFFIYILFGR